MLPTTHGTLNWAQLSGKQGAGASSRRKSIPIEGTLSDKGSGEGREPVGWGKCPREEVYEVKGQHWVAGSNSGGCGLQDGLPGKTV